MTAHIYYVIFLTSLLSLISLNKRSVLTNGWEAPYYLRVYGEKTQTISIFLATMNPYIHKATTSFLMDNGEGTKMSSIKNNGWWSQEQMVPIRKLGGQNNPYEWPKDTFWLKTSSFRGTILSFSIYLHYCSAYNLLYNRKLTHLFLLDT